MKKRESGFLILRYLILLSLGLFNLWVFYKIFTPLTVYPVYWILKAFDAKTSLFAGNLIFFGGEYAEIVRACVAGAAYYLLLILNLAMPMEWKKRVKSLVFLFGGFLALNIIRIVVFFFLLVNGKGFFDLAHYAVWYLGSTILVVGVWFVNIWLFNIKKIPIYTDARTLLRDALGKWGKNWQENHKG